MYFLSIEVSGEGNKENRQYTSKMLLKIVVKITVHYSYFTNQDFKSEYFLLSLLIVTALCATKS